MSSISGLGKSSLLLSMQQSSSTIRASQASAASSFEPKFEQAVKDSGGTNVNFDDLQSQIKSALKSVIQSAGSSTDPSSMQSQIQTAVDQVLTNNGIDTSKFQSEIGPPPGGPFGGPPPGGIGGTNSSSSTDDLSTLLSALESGSSTTSTSSSSSADSTTSIDDMMAQLMKDVLKNLPSGTFVNTSA